MILNWNGSVIRNPDHFSLPPSFSLQFAGALTAAIFWVGRGTEIVHVKYVLQLRSDLEIKHQTYTFYIMSLYQCVMQKVLYVDHIQLT